ncbi:MAG: hypothetical protein WAO35_11285 [Terriglobia bacterium]
MDPKGKLQRPGKVGQRVLAVALLLICAKPLVAQEAEGQLPPHKGELTRISATTDEGCATAAPNHPGVAEALPDAPEPQTAPSPQNPPTPSPQVQAPASSTSSSAVIAFLPPARSQKRLTPKDKFQIYVHQNFGPQNFILPAFGAGFSMLNPPRHYPRKWEDGGGAFGRWYGEQLAASTSNRTAQVLTEVTLHEDPRYVPSGSRNVLIRISHAIAFTFVDKTDSGHNTFALSNIAGAAAGGFVGMSFLPGEYGDVRHAEQRALRGLATVAVRNIVTEFRPEYEPTLRKIHIPSILPAWWTRKNPPLP